MARWAAIAADGLGRLMVRMKSDAFAEEHEWRAIIIRFSFDTAVVRFRLAANGVVVPYHPWLFKRDGVKAVRQVRHGPTVNSRAGGALAGPVPAQPGLPRRGGAGLRDPAARVRRAAGVQRFTSSTRRFPALPSSVALEATGA